LLSLRELTLKFWKNVIYEQCDLCMFTYYYRETTKEE
jgi:hypothetical protein